MRLGPAGLLALLTLSACATARVTPVSNFQVTEKNPDKRICIIENPRVKSGFFDAYRTALEGKGFSVVVVQKMAQPSICPVTTRYLAYWNWDLVLYLSYAQLDVYVDGKPAGRAIHNARNSRFIDTEATIKELINRLFPE